MLQIACGQRTAQQIKDRRAKILGRRHAIGKQRIEIQVGVVESIQYLRPHRSVELYQINNHSRLRVDRAAHQYFNEIVMSMAVLVVALSVGRAVCFCRERRRMQPVTGAEHVTAPKVRFHASPLYSAKISGVS